MAVVIHFLNKISITLCGSDDSLMNSRKHKLGFPHLVQETLDEIRVQLLM